GPVHDVSVYPPEYLPCNTSNPREVELRSPGRWLASIHVPVFVFEGTLQGNLLALQLMANPPPNLKLRFLPVRCTTQFSILAPLTGLIASKVVQDTGPTCNLTFTEQEVNNLFGR